MGHVFKWMGSKEQARALWENEEALAMYMARLKEIMEGVDMTEEERVAYIKEFVGKCKNYGKP